MNGRLALAVLLVMAGCARGPASAASAAAPDPLHVAPTSDLVPAGRLRWVADVRTRELLTNAALIPAIAEVLPEAELSAMAKAWGGIDPRSAEELVIAGYDGGALFLAHQAIDPGRVEAAFAAQLADVEGRAIDQASDDSRAVVTRVWGATGKRHETLVLLGREVAGLGVFSEARADAPIRAVELFALQRLKRAKPVWRAAPLDRVAELLGDAPVRAGAPGPFEGSWGSGLGGLLAAATAAGVAVQPVGANLRVTLVVTGAWGERASEAKDRLERRYAMLAASGLGRLLGIDRPESPPVVTATVDTLRLEVLLRAGPFFRGLRDATTAQLEGIMSQPDGRNGP